MICDTTIFFFQSMCLVGAFITWVNSLVLVLHSSCDVIVLSACEQKGLMTIWRCQRWARCRSDRPPSDSHSTFVMWREPGGWHRHRRAWTYQMWSSAPPRPPPVPPPQKKPHASPAAKAFFFLQRWHDVAADRDIMYTAIVRVRREERNWPSACRHVCFTQARAAMPPKQMHNHKTPSHYQSEAGRVTWSRWNLVYLTLQTFPSRRLPPPLDRLSYVVIAM